MFADSFLHVGLHVVIVAVSLSLLAVSLLALRRSKRRRFCLVCAAFAVFAVKEALVAVNISFLQSPVLEIVSHGLDLIILGCFFAGVMDMGR